MRRISAMYKWSGGTDYRHTCKECKNCKKIGKGNKVPYKCMVYGNTNSAASDWKISYIACKAFNIDYRGKPLIELVKRQQQEKEANIEGQMSFNDFPEVMP